MPVTVGSYTGKDIGLRPRNVTLTRVYLLESLLTMVDVQGFEVWERMANPGKQRRVGSPYVKGNYSRDPA